jgi:hypothetical protein
MSLMLMVEEVEAVIQGVLGEVEVWLEAVVGKSKDLVSM